MSTTGWLSVIGSFMPKLLLTDNRSVPERLQVVYFKFNYKNKNIDV